MSTIPSKEQPRLAIPRLACELQKIEVRLIQRLAVRSVLTANKLCGSFQLAGAGVHVVQSLCQHDSTDRCQAQRNQHTGHTVCPGVSKKASDAQIGCDQLLQPAHEPNRLLLSTADAYFPTRWMKPFSACACCNTFWPSCKRQRCRC